MDANAKAVRAGSERVTVVVTFQDGTEYRADPILPSKDVATIRSGVETYFKMAATAPQFLSLAITNLLRTFGR